MTAAREQADTERLAAAPTEAERELAHRIWNDALCNSDVPGWKRDDLLAQALAEQRARYDAIAAERAADELEAAAEALRSQAHQWPSAAWECERRAAALRAAGRTTP